MIQPNNWLTLVTMPYQSKKFLNLEDKWKKYKFENISKVQQILILNT